MYNPHTKDTAGQSWGLVLFGGFLTIIIGLSLTILGVVLVNTIWAAYWPMSAIATVGIVVSFYLYYVGLKVVFIEYE